MDNFLFSGDPMTPTIRLYCAQPKCHEPGYMQIPFGDELLYTCLKHFYIFTKSFPHVAARSTVIKPGDYLPLGYDPIKQTKKEGGQFTVKRTIGGKKP